MSEDLTLEFCRQAIESIRGVKSPALSAMSPKDRKEYLVGAEAIDRNWVFHAEMERILDEQRQFLAEQARTEMEVSFARATINAVKLIKEHFNQLHILLEDEYAHD